MLISTSAELQSTDEDMSLMKVSIDPEVMAMGLWISSTNLWKAEYGSNPLMQVKACLVTSIILSHSAKFNKKAATLRLLQLFGC